MESTQDTATPGTLSEFANGQVTRLRRQARRLAKRTDGVVRDNPWQLIGIAALVGLAVGIFASRRS
jgi:ElaB/YqjD/DUF883 family membrane-anchored ribosome-binding protein